MTNLPFSPRASLREALIRWGSIFSAKSEQVSNSKSSRVSSYIPLAILLSMAISSCTPPIALEQSESSTNRNVASLREKATPSAMNKPNGFNELTDVSVSHLKGSRNPAGEFTLNRSFDGQATKKEERNESESTSKLRGDESPNKPNIAINRGSSLAISSNPNDISAISHAGIVVQELCELSNGQLLVLGKGGEVSLFSGSKPNITPLARIPIKLDVVKCAPNGDLFLSSTESLEVRGLSGEVIARLPPSKSRVLSASFEHNNGGVVFGTADGTVYRWRYRAEFSAADIRQGKNLERYLGHPSAVTAVANHPYGRIFVSGSLIGEVFIWLRYDADSASGEFDRNMLGAGAFIESPVRAKLPRSRVGEITAVRFSSDGELLYVGDGDGFLEVWKVRGMKLLSSVNAHRGSLFSLAEVAGSRIVTVGRDDEIKLWGVEVEEGVDPSQRDYRLVVRDTRIESGVRKVYQTSGGSTMISNLDGLLRRINWL